jgi:hypothetical protein
MRHLTFVIIAIIIFASCKDKIQNKVDSQIWTEEQKRKFYTDSFSYSDNDFLNRRDTSINFVTFMNEQYPNLKSKNKYDPFIYALEEPYIDTTQIDTTKNWFRLVVRPCFRLPYCFVVEKKDGKSFLTTKITNGYGGYYTGVLISTMRFPFGDTLYNNISSQLASLNFWSLGSDTTCHGGFDGETWTFEAIENGKYNIISRWVPQTCGDSTTIKLSKIGLNLGKLSRLDNVLIAIGATKSGM